MTQLRSVGSGRTVSNNAAPHHSASPRSQDRQPATTTSTTTTTTTSSSHTTAQRHPVPTSGRAARGDTPDNAVYDGAPPPKRRRLSIRPSARQTNIADFFARPKPPNNTRVSLAAPHGQLVQTINGVRSVLDTDEDELLQPGPSPVPRRDATRSPHRQQPRQKHEDKRTLRSQDDGPRLKSELAVYFPNYDDIIFDTPQEDDYLSADTTLYVTDDAAKITKSEASSASKAGNKSAVNSSRASVNGTGPPPSTPQRTSSNQFNGSPSLNLDFVANNIPDNPDDPLSDEHFLKSHRRAERKEKQLRNIERERAMHEKVQLERLLEGLQGHDWLKVLGITGVTDTEAKKYETKRDYFIAEVRALVDKFRQWKEQEKRQRLDKEAAAAAREAAGDEGDTSEGSVEPPSSDLNASAARQLQQETVNALKASSAKGSRKGKERLLPTSHPSQPSTPTVHVAPRPAPLPPPEVPFTSFYSKPHLRDAALGKARHGRNITAFGQPLPDMEEGEFVLPDDYITEDALRANAREKRRRKRESAANAASKT